MVAIPQRESTVDQIYRLYESRAESGFRPHLGASIIGKSCERALWYDFRWATPAKFPGRVLRLFNTGFREEDRFIEELRSIGCTVHPVDPKTGRQFKLQAHGGHFGCSLDGAILGLVEAPATWHVLEFKTSNKKNFKSLETKGVQASKPVHYAQMQIGMGLSGMTRAFYMAVEKDTDSLYAERVEFNKTFFDGLIERAGRVIFSKRPGPKIATNAGYYECKFCDHADVCWQGKEPAINCRTCDFSFPEKNGAWRCLKLEKTLSVKDQMKGCERYCKQENL